MKGEFTMKFRVKKKKDVIAKKKWKKESDRIYDLITQRVYSSEDIDKFAEDVINQKYASMWIEFDVKDYPYLEDSVTGALVTSIPEKKVPYLSSGDTRKTSHCILLQSEETGLFRCPFIRIVHEDFINTPNKKDMIKFAIFHELGHIILAGCGIDKYQTETRLEILADQCAAMLLELTPDEACNIISNLIHVVRIDENRDDIDFVKYPIEKRIEAAKNGWKDVKLIDSVEELLL